MRQHDDAAGAARRRLAAAACVAAVVVVVVTGVAIGVGAGSRSGSAPDPAAAPAVPAPGSVAATVAAVRPGSTLSAVASAEPRAPGPECRADRLEASYVGQLDGAGGRLFHGVVFTNRGVAACLLRGYPQLVRAVSDGLPAVTAEHGASFPVEPAQPMAPGEYSVLALQTDSTCPPTRHADGASGPAYHRIEVRLDGRIFRLLAPGRGLDVTCGLHVTPFYTDTVLDR